MSDHLSVGRNPDPMMRKEEVEWWVGMKGFEQGTRATKLGREVEIDDTPRAIVREDLVREVAGVYSFYVHGHIVAQLENDAKGWWHVTNGTSPLLVRAASGRYWNRKSAHAVALQAVGHHHMYLEQVHQVIDLLGLEEVLPEFYLELTMQFAEHLFTTVDGAVEVLKPRYEQIA